MVDGHNVAHDIIFDVNVMATHHMCAGAGQRRLASYGEDEQS